MKAFQILLAVLAIGFAAQLTARAETSVEVIPRPSSSSKNDYYIGNRPPLLPSALIKLPVGTIEPRGWLLEILERQRNGMTGHLPEISAWLQKDGNAWLSADGRGKWGWEEVPYWLRGYIVLAQMLNDEQMLNESSFWIEAVIAGQRQDGNFGPLRVFGDDDSQDIWANMIMLNCLQSYYEYSDDLRILDLMTKYFKLLSTIPDDKLLTHYWQFYRGGDILYSIYWLYNHTGEDWLLDLAERIHANTANWKLNDNVPTWHVVNIAQAFNEPGVYYMQSHDPQDLAAAYRNFNLVRARYGQVPGGMYGADENARVGYDDPRQGTETCGFVEQMRSDEDLLGITGDPFWADHCEEVAFNSLPAAYMPDFRSLRYLTCPNLPRSDAKDHAPGVQNGGPMFTMNALSHRCCQHNHTQGWPRFVEHLWMATSDNGICATMYGPCEIRAKVADDAEVRIKEQTKYPFDEAIAFEVAIAKPAAFPLYLRIPKWCRESTVEVGGEPVAQNVAPSSYVRIFRTWKTGDTVTLRLPMDIELRRWPRNHNSVTVDRGPLTYSLKIGEEYVPRNAMETALQDSQWRDDTDVEAWPAFEILPKTSWNYGLVLDGESPKNGFRVETKNWPADEYPFTADNVPIRLRGKARQIPGWKYDLTGLCSVLRDSPIYSSMPDEEITLIPMGAARLRISAFPEVQDDRNLPTWIPEMPKEMRYAPSASQCESPDTVEALVDGLEPCASSDRGIPRQTFLPNLGTKEWLQADFDEPRYVDQVSIYWCDDRDQYEHVPTGVFDTLPSGKNCRVPKSWKLYYRAGDEWKEVDAQTNYGKLPNRFNTLSFASVETTGLRLEVQLASRATAGVLEWRIPPAAAAHTATN